MSGHITIITTVRWNLLLFHRREGNYCDNGTRLSKFQILFFRLFYISEFDIQSCSIQSLRNFCNFKLIEFLLHLFIDFLFQRFIGKQIRYKTTHYTTGRGWWQTRYIYPKLVFSKCFTCVYRKVVSFIIVRRIDYICFYRVSKTCEINRTVSNVQIRLEISQNLTTWQ